MVALRRHFPPPMVCDSPAPRRFGPRLVHSPNSSMSCANRPTKRRMTRRARYRAGADQDIGPEETGGRRCSARVASTVRASNARASVRDGVYLICPKREPRRLRSASRCSTDRASPATSVERHQRQHLQCVDQHVSPDSERSGQRPSSEIVDGRGDHLDQTEKQAGHSKQHGHPPMPKTPASGTPATTPRAPSAGRPVPRPRTGDISCKEGGAQYVQFPARLVDLLVGGTGGLRSTSHQRGPGLTRDRTARGPNLTGGRADLACPRHLPRLGTARSSACPGTRSPGGR